VCSGSRTSTESVSAICWCGVKIWFRIGVTKTVVLLLNDLNSIKKHVEDISVDAISGSKFCSLVVIYDTNYSTNNYIILTTVSSPCHHYHSWDINGVLQSFIYCTSSQSTCQLCHTVKWETNRNEVWSDNTNYIILPFTTLPTCNCICENFSAFKKTNIYTRQRYKICMLRRFINCYIKNSANQPLWGSATVRQKAAEIGMWCFQKLNIDIASLIFISTLVWVDWPAASPLGMNPVPIEQVAGDPQPWSIECWARDLILPLLEFEPRTVQPVASHCTHFTVPATYSSLVFTKWDMMTIGELSQMRYLRLLLGLTMLDCQRNCHILNRLKIDNIVIVKATSVSV